MQIELEPAQRTPALALATLEGIFATPAFLSELGLDPPPSGVVTLDAWLGPLAHGERRIRRSSEGLPPGSEIAWLEDRPRRTRFLRRAAHDLRGPVANVRSFASLLRAAQPDLSARAQRALETIERNADRALALLHDYFTSAQAAEGRLAIEVEATDVGPLIQAAAEQASPAASARGVALEWEELALLPPVAVDPATFRHALDAVLAWTISRAQKGGRVRIRPRRREDALEIAVAGDGPPLAADELSNLFDPEFWAEREGGLQHGFRLAVAAAELRGMGSAVRALDEAGAAGIGLAARIVSA